MTIAGYLLPSASLETRAALRHYIDAFAVASSRARESINRKSAAIAASVCASAEGIVLGFSGQPRLKSEPRRPLAAESLLERYRAKGQAFLTDLCGGFSIAIIHPAERRLVLAVDPMGIGRMAFWRNGETIVFGDRAGTVAHAPGVDAPIHAQRIFDFLFFHMIPAPYSMFAGITKLEPGSAALFEDGRHRIEPYWKPTFDYRGAPRAEALERELMATLEAAVRDAGLSMDTGAFLSGGLDSSTVAGMARRVADRAVPTFSIGFGEPGYDELDYARIANAHFGCSGHEYVVTPDDVIATLPTIAVAYDEPFGNSSAVPVLHCAKLARAHGVTHLLAGDGGDELFAGNERYAKQRVFELYGRVPGAIRGRLTRWLLGSVPPEGGFTPLRKLRSYAEQASTPLPDRLESWNYAYREGIGRMLAHDFATSVDVDSPLELMRAVYDRTAGDNALDRQLAYDWHFTLADSDLPKVSTMCELAGVDVSYPMLDHRLVALCERVPPHVKMRHLALRSFYKRATRGFLPTEILKKQKHGFGLPFGRWLKSHPPLADLVYTTLRALNQRRIFQTSFIDGLIDQQKSGHDAYYGTFLWDLTVLEQWLQREALDRASQRDAQR